MAGDQSDPNYMLSLARGLQVLRAFQGHGSLTAAEAARRSGLSRPSAGRCLYTLEKLGYVSERDGRYALTPGLLPLAAGFLTSRPLASASQAVANAVRNTLLETVSVAALDPTDPYRIIYIARAEKTQVIAAPLMVGSTLPSDCTSMGRVLLAAMGEDEREGWLSGADLVARTAHTLTTRDALRSALRDVAAQRWSIIEEELELGLRSLAVPVRDSDGIVVAAINVATFSDEHSREQLLHDYLPALRGAAAQLERAI